MGLIPILKFIAQSYPAHDCDVRHQLLLTATVSSYLAFLLDL